MNETEGHFESDVETHSEDNPNIERLEQQILGNHYEQAEALHKFANEHAWFHPTLILIGVAVIIGVILLVLRARKNRTP